MAQALEQLKRQFGPNAVILNTRTSPKNGLFGFGAKGYVEITAARAMSDLPATLRPVTFKRGSGRTEQADGAARPVSPNSTTIVSKPSDKLLSEIATLKGMVSELVRRTGRPQAAVIPEALYETYIDLLQNEVAENIAQRLIDQVCSALGTERLNDPVAVRMQLAHALEGMLPVAGPIRIAPIGEPTLIALVGPTGVGKTTTVAKLAANFALREHRKVGLITIDTYRIAAVEQLRTYAQIIEVPLEVVISPDQLKEAVARMADRDVVLIDTAGRSQRDAVKVKELQGFFGAVTPHEVHLVLSSTTGEGVLAETIERFGEIGIDRVILTKLDEAIGFGVILTCLHKAKAKLSYLTTGQDVPDDISVGEGKAIARLSMGRQLPKV